MLWSRGTIFMALLVGLPVVLAVLVRGVQAIGGPDMQVDGKVITGPTIFGFMVWWLYLRFIVPVLALYYGTALVADEVGLIHEVTSPDDNLQAVFQYLVK